MTRRHAGRRVAYVHWRDAVFATGSIVFIVALIPTLRGRDKPALSTSLLTGGFLLAYALTYLTMDLWFSAVTTSALGASWLYLGYQRFVTGDWVRW